MKLEEARKRAKEYEEWLNSVEPPKWREQMQGASFDAALDQRKAIRDKLRGHCYNHFDEVVAALERLVEHDDGEHNGCDRNPCDWCYARIVLAKAKEVKV